MGNIEIGCCIFFSIIFHLSSHASLQKHTTILPNPSNPFKDEAEAHQELLHFQNAYPSDPRAFFSTRRARQVGTSVLQRLRTKFPAQERVRVKHASAWVSIKGYQALKKGSFFFVSLLKSSLLLIFSYFFGIENKADTLSPTKKTGRIVVESRPKSLVSRSFGLMCPPFELAKEREIRTDPSWMTFWFFGFYKIPNYLELRLLQWK